MVAIQIKRRKNARMVFSNREVFIKFKSHMHKGSYLDLCGIWNYTEPTKIQNSTDLIISHQITSFTFRNRLAWTNFTVACSSRFSAYISLLPGKRQVFPRLVLMSGKNAEIWRQQRVSCGQLFSMLIRSTQPHKSTKKIAYIFNGCHVPENDWHMRHQNENMKTKPFTRIQNKLTRRKENSKTYSRNNANRSFHLVCDSW